MKVIVDSVLTLSQDIDDATVEELFESSDELIDYAEDTPLSAYGLAFFYFFGTHLRALANEREKENV